MSLSLARAGDAFLELIPHLYARLRLMRSVLNPALSAINGLAAGADFLLPLGDKLHIASTACRRQPL